MKSVRNGAECFIFALHSVIPVMQCKNDDIYSHIRGIDM